MAGVPRLSEKVTGNPPLGIDETPAAILLM